MITLILFSVCVATFVFYSYVIKNLRIAKVINNIPQAKHFPIIGSAIEFGTNPDEILNNLFQIQKKYGPIVKGWLGPNAFVILSSVDDIETILSNTSIINKSYIYNLLGPWLGMGLLTAHGELWRKKRKLITPAFHFQILEQFIDVFYSNAVILVDKLKAEVGNSGFDVVKYVNFCTLDIIAESSMGVKINAQKNESAEFAEAIHHVTSAIIYRAFKPWLHMDWSFRLTDTGRSFYKNINCIHSFIEKVIENKREQRMQKKASNETEKSSDEELLGSKKRVAFLDLILDYYDDNNDLTDKDISDEVNTIMTTGHDTTTSAISFTLYALMKHQEVQEKVLIEMKEVLGDLNKPVTYSDLQKMRYLDKVIKESLRLYPIIPYISRSLTEDVVLKSGYILPRGVSVVLFLNQLHQDPTAYPEPEVFDPERFEVQNSNGRKPFSFCPFSAGPRNCIGQRYAILEMKIVLLTILRSYRIVPPIGLPDIHLTAEIVLRSTTGINIRLVNR